MKITVLLLVLTLAGCGGDSPTSQMPSADGRVEVSCAGFSNTDECLTRTTTTASAGRLYKVGLMRTSLPVGEVKTTIAGGVVSRSQYMTIKANVANTTLTDFVSFAETWLETGCQGEDGFMAGRAGPLTVPAGVDKQVVGLSTRCSAMPLGPNAMYAIIYDADGFEVDRIKVTYTVIE